MKKRFYFLLTIFSSTAIYYSQVGINTPDPQATLDVVASVNSSVKDGIMPPRISKQTLASKAAGVYGTAQTGAIVYVDNVVAPSGITPSLVQVANINNSGYYYFTGTQWQAYSNLYNSDGSLTGNRTVTQGANTLSFLSNAVNGFSVDGTTFSVDASNNRIGIGNAAPATDLHIGDGTTGATPTIRLTSSLNDYAGGGVLQFLENNQGYGTIIRHHTADNATVTQREGLYFNSFSATVESTTPTLMLDQVNQRVGIGTAIPETKLHVVSTTPTSGRFNVIDAPQSTLEAPILTLRNNSALATDNKAYIGFSNAGPTAGGSNWQVGSIRTSATGGGGQEDFYVGNSTGGVLVERMRILPNTGFVGIGVSVPTNKLHINATNPIRLEGLQGATATAGSLTVDNTGVVQTRNSSNISAVRAVGNMTITVNNTFTNVGTASETFDNLNEYSGSTFTAAAAGLYKVDFAINYPQRAATEDSGDGYLAYARINLNGAQYSAKMVKVPLPEVSGAPSSITCSNSELVKMNAGDTLTFQGLTFGSTPATTNIVSGYFLTVSRVD